MPARFIWTHDTQILHTQHNIKIAHLLMNLHRMPTRLMSTHGKRLRHPRTPNEDSSANLKLVKCQPLQFNSPKVHRMSHCKSNHLKFAECQNTLRHPCTAQDNSPQTQDGSLINVIAYCALASHANSKNKYVNIICARLMKTVQLT